MNRYTKRSLLTVFILTLAGLAVFYYFRIFGNVCIDGDTLNQLGELARRGDRLTLLNSIACMGWFSKFHLSLFPLLYISTKAYSIFDGWDLLMGFKILAYLSTLGTFCLVFLLCKKTISRLSIVLLASLVPFLTLGPCWLATTCDDNAVASFFEILFLLTVFVCCLSLKDKGRNPAGWGFAAGVTAGLNLAAHLKNIVTLPVLLAPAFVRPSGPKRKFRTLVAAAIGLLISIGGLYLIYYLMSAAAPSGSKTDFLVFHRQPGRFFFTRYESSVLDWLYFIYIGIRATLYTFQELYVHTNIFDRDILGPVLIVLFFLLYGIAVVKTRSRLSTKLLLAYFLCHFIHSSLYDSWVSERWDAIVIPVVATIGIFWDSVLTDVRSKRIKIAVSMAVLLLFGGLVTTNFVQTDRLLAITSSSRPYTRSAVPWPYPKKFFFFFNQKELYEFAKGLDGYLDEKTGFIPMRYTQPVSSHTIGYLDSYLTFYSKAYRTQQIKDIATIAPLVESGKLNRIVYIDEYRVPFYYEGGRRGIVFMGDQTRTIFKGNQITLKEMKFFREKETE